MDDQIFDKMKFQLKNMKVSNINDHHLEYFLSLLLHYYYYYNKHLHKLREKTAFQSLDISCQNFQTQENSLFLYYIIFFFFI